MKETTINKVEKEMKHGSYPSHLGDEWRSEDLSRHEGELDEGIGLFFGFTTVSFVLLSLFVFLVLYLISPRLAEFHPIIPPVVMLAAIVVVGVTSILLVLTYLTVVTGKNLFPSALTKGGRDKGLIMLVTPLAVKLGGMCGFSRDRIASSFIKVNNALVFAAQNRSKTRSLLILLPRCIQHSKCKQKVEIDIDNCKDCGLCDIADIIKLCEDNSIESFVATGGNIARQLIKEKRPSGII